jgi:rod shape-determining protein MreC
MDELGQYRREGLGKREGNRRLSLVFLLACSFLMFTFSLYGAQASVFDKARETLLDISEPILNLLSKPIKFVDNRLGDISDYVFVLRENERLREENAELRAWMNEAVTLRQQVKYFENLLQLKVADGASYVDAQIVGEAGGPYQRSMVLNAGRNDGVETGDAVITTEGMIGHIITAGNSASRVLLLTDFASRTPVYIEGAGIEAIIAGRYLDEPEIRFLSTRDLDGLQEGQRIITSGVGGRLPRGIPIGTVGDTTGDVIPVKLYTRYQDTDYVRVVDYQFTEAPAEPTIQEIAETAENADG